MGRLASSCDEVTAVEFGRKPNAKAGETQETLGFIANAPARTRTNQEKPGEIEFFEFGTPNHTPITAHRTAFVMGQAG